MFPLVAAVFGGAAVAAGSYSYLKIRSFRKFISGQEGGPDGAPFTTEIAGLIDDLHFAARSEITKHGRKLTFVISQSAATVRDEAQILAHGVYEEAQAAFEHVNEIELRPLRESVRDVWHAFTAFVSDDEGILADSGRAAQDFFRAASAGTAGALQRGRKAIADSPVGEWSAPAKPRPGSPKRPVSMNPRAVWLSLRQAKNLVFDDTRSRQVEEMSGPRKDRRCRRSRWRSVASIAISASPRLPLLSPP